MDFCDRKESDTCVSEEESVDENDVNNDHSLSKMSSCDQFPSTQFYFTQFDNNIDDKMKQTSVQKCDIVECLLEGLERPNGKLDINLLENINDEELVELVCDLEKKLNITGTYNLCCSLNNMSLEEGMKYVSIFYTYLLLPKIIALEEPSRMLISAIVESVKKFPNDVQNSIFIPLLNANLKDATITTAIVNAFESERNHVLIEEYLSHTKELKLWHLPILQSLISVKMDPDTKEKFVHLLSKKALEFSKEKNFGKLVLSFIKVNVNFSEQQKLLLWEIGDINQTFFKKPMQNMLKGIMKNSNIR
ncbi:uncharacterized protein LOC116423873 isoform X2 [Nomia melanderi]|uniref:uncharacterized protein LOC116423873 isoform X2 n=1 Tax=Nomia melanderi TaxID=2448451 RepID=UPI001304389A|nr:uncharacterized protein LOC116423873 isoform X2 [Nomia melanderi]